MRTDYTPPPEVGTAPDCRTCRGAGTVWTYCSCPGSSGSPRGKISARRRRGRVREGTGVTAESQRVPDGRPHVMRIPLPARPRRDRASDAPAPAEAQRGTVPGVTLPVAAGRGPRGRSSRERRGRPCSADRGPPQAARRARPGAPVPRRRGLDRARPRPGGEHDGHRGRAPGGGSRRDRNDLQHGLDPRTPADPAGPAARPLARRRRLRLGACEGGLLPDDPRAAGEGRGHLQRPPDSTASCRRAGRATRSAPRWGSRRRTGSS